VAQLLILTSAVDGDVLPALGLLSHRVRSIPAEPASLITAPAADLIFVDAFTGSYIPFHLMTREFYQLVRSRLASHGVAAFNFIPSEKLFESNLRTVRLAFDNIDIFNSGDRDIMMSNVIVLGHLDPSSETEALQRAVVAQERYKFRFDVSKLVIERRVPAPKELKGNVLTDDFAAADVLDARGRKYQREK